MFTIPIEPIPKQEFSTRLDDFRYVLTLREAAGVMSVTIERDGVTLIRNVRAVANSPLLPYVYQEGGGGNFAFRTINDELPDWRKFNTSQQLIYATAAELGEMRNG